MSGTRWLIIGVRLATNAYHILAAVTTLSHGLYAIALQAVLVEEFLFVLACCPAGDTKLEVRILRYDTLCGSAFLLASFSPYPAGSGGFAPLLLLCAGLFRYVPAVLLWKQLAYLRGIAPSLAFILYGMTRVAASGRNGTGAAVIPVRGVAAASLGAAKLGRPAAAVVPSAAPASQPRQNPAQDQRRAGRDLVDEGREVAP